MNNRWEKVGDGIERMAQRTPTLPPATETNTYLISGARGFFVVEPATPYAREQRVLFDQVRARLSSGDMLLGAVVTHHHVDHVGSAAEFRIEFGVPLFAHALAKERLAGRVPVDRTLGDDDVLDGTDVTAMHTPGHAPGHVCLWSKGCRWLVAGDMVASVGSIVIDPDDGGDMREYMTQLERLTALPVERILPAHGGPIDTPHELLEHYTAHRREREDKVATAVRRGDRDPAGRVTLGEVVRRAYADTPAWLWPLASKSARAHLAKLVKDGEVSAVADGWSPGH
ncbi:MAG: MBL fold metallo-hydrolase [Deltaproteobacteria bacterium]